MTPWKNYHIARSIEDAVAALRSATGPVMPVSGGTDLLLELQQGHHAPVDTLVDVSQIPEMKHLELRDGELFIGAGVPVSQVTESPLVKLHAKAVSEACGLIGGPQVRNTATLGGNVAHALPAADGMISLVAMDAQVTIAGPNGLRTAPILTLFKGPGKNTLDLGEILVGFTLAALRPGQASAFARVMRPQGVALPILNLAVWLDRVDDTIRDIRIAVGPAGPTPQRALAVEATLKDHPYSPECFAAALDAWRTAMKFRTSPHRSTAAYRHHLSSGLLEQVLNTAWERAALPVQALHV